MGILTSWSSLGGVSLIAGNTHEREKVLSMRSTRFVPQARWDGLLTMTPGAVIYRGPGGDADSHAHHAVQLMISPDEPFVLELEGNEKRTAAALIPSGSKHKLRCSSERLLLMLVEPSGARGRSLNAIAERMTGLELERALVLALAKSADTSDAAVVIDSLIRAIDPALAERAAQLSNPVNSALRYLENTASSKPSLEQAAAAAHISPSRLTHLFHRRSRYSLSAIRIVGPTQTGSGACGRRYKPHPGGSRGGVQRFCSFEPGVQGEFRTQPLGPLRDETEPRCVA